MGEDLKPAMPTAYRFSLNPGASADPPAPVFSHQLVIGKAPLNSLPAKQTSASQQALATFLAKKREKYKNKLNSSLDSRLECSDGVQRSKRTSPQNHVHVSISAPFGLYSSSHSLDHLHESKCILRIASLDSQGLYSHRNKLEYEKRAQRSPLKDQDRGLNTSNTSSDFVKLGSEELADKVVSRARLRRRNIKKHSYTFQKEVLKPIIKLHHERPMAPPLSTSTPIPPCSPSFSTPSKSPQKKERRTSHSMLIKGEEPTTRAKSLGLSKSLDELHETANNNPLHSKQIVPVRRVIFQSEKQSATSKDTGIPSVPPPTPRAGSAPDVKIVPSMSDIKSQRDLKSRLNLITAKSQECLEKQQQLKIEKEKREKKVALNRLKMQQRAEIYALNKVMAEFERQKFESFMSGKV